MKLFVDVLSDMGDKNIETIEKKKKCGIYEKYIKRLQDIVCALLAIIILSPIMLLTALLVRVKLGSPVIFAQERPGLHGKIFKLYKFRSMSDERDKDGNLLPDTLRLGEFGKALRTSSLDELPELINILKGDMTLVGPRPLLVRYLSRYNAHQARRHEARPGITGFAQVNGRNAISWEEKFNYDIKYVEHITFLGDWKIIFQTVLTVLKRDGISSNNSVTMEEFMGSGIEEYHILFTGVGRRVELIQAFRQAAINVNIKLKLYGADMVEDAPALAFCDCTRKVCSMGNKEYISQLLEICKNDSINLLIPLIDTDLLVLSKNVHLFESVNTKVLISDSDKIAVCRDKNCTADFFMSCGLKTPLTVNDYGLYIGPYPCFIKPKDGSSSINAFKVNVQEELAIFADKIDNYIIQPFIDGVEFTIDIFCDFMGNPIYITPRERLAVRSGEVLKTKIELDSKIINESLRLVKAYKPCGPLTVQLIREDTTGEDYFIEINPRYGGGAPLSMKAGARSAETVLMLLSGQKVKYKEDGICNGAVYSRYDQSVCVNMGKTKQPIRGVIFDLDDTLYSEKQYVKSGFKAISMFLGDTGVEERLWNYFADGKSSVDELLKELKLMEKKEECLEIYRSHMPDISLYENVKEVILKFKEKGIKVGIITDGRVQGQKNKIKALKLKTMMDDIIITDELGGEPFRKPNDISFRIMQNRWGIPFEQMVYVGDNPAKDFRAPRQLGMRSICYINEDGLYNQTETGNIENMIDWKELPQLLE